MSSLSSRNNETRNLVVSESQRANQTVTVPPTQLSDFYIRVGTKEKALGF